MALYTLTPHLRFLVQKKCTTEHKNKNPLFSFFDPHPKMLTFIASCFHKVLHGEILESVESKTSASSKFIYRDDLRKKRSLSKQSLEKPLLKVVKVDEKDPNMSSRRGFDGEETVRVKVKMTKEEAARLLSRCKDGGVLEFKDVAREIVNLPMNRVTVVSSFPATNSLLDSIQEEC